MKTNILIAILLAGLLTSCGVGPTETPATSTPAFTAPTDTALPTQAVSQPTVPPTSDSSAQTATVSFSADVFPILQSRCINCHGGNKVEKGLIMTSHADILAGSENGPVITPGDASNSLMAELILAQKMPKRGPKLTPPQVQTIIDWINQGALDN